MTAQRVALVTGTSSGIGLYAAIGLAQAGLHVIATMRDPARSGALLAVADEAGVTLEVAPLDVTDEVGAASCVAQALTDHGAIDVLVNNAGRGHRATLEHLSMDEIREQMEVNYFGVAALTKLVLPSMRRAGRGRIVTVTSVGGAVGQPFADAYCASKFAVEGLMQSVAPVVAPFGVEVCIVEPAAVASEFAANVHGAEEVAADDPYRDQLTAYNERLAGSFARAQSSADAAAVVVQACTVEAPKFRWQTSKSAVGFVGLSLADLDGSAVIGQTSTWISP